MLKYFRKFYTVCRILEISVHDYMMQRRISKWSCSNSKQQFLTSSATSFCILIYKFYFLIFFYIIVFLECWNSDYPSRYISIILRFISIYCDFNWCNRVGWDVFLLRTATPGDTWNIQLYVEHSTEIYRFSEWGGLTEIFRRQNNQLLVPYGGKRIKTKPNQETLCVIIDINNAEADWDTVNT